jgi:hypothetical protein
MGINAVVILNGKRPKVIGIEASDEWGTAVNVRLMVSGMGANSATGVAFLTRQQRNNFMANT